MKRPIHQHGELDNLNHNRSVTSSVELVIVYRHYRDKPLLNFQVLLMTGAAEFITRCSLSVVNLGDPATGGQYGIRIVYTRRHKCMNECCC